MKNNTEKQEKQFEHALTFLKSVERYVEMADDKIPVTPKDLGMSSIRDHCYGHNASLASEGLNNMKKLLKPYLTILEPLGYTKAKQTELDTIITDINANKTEYNSLLNERKQLVSDNSNLFDDLWDYLHDILKTGKTIFKNDPIKIKEYTQKDILERIERDIKDKDKGNGTTGTTSTTENK